MKKTNLINWQKYPHLYLPVIIWTSLLIHDSNSIDPVSSTHKPYRRTNPSSSTVLHRQCYRHPPTWVSRQPRTLESSTFVPLSPKGKPYRDATNMTQSMSSDTAMPSDELLLPIVSCPQCINFHILLVLLKVFCWSKKITSLRAPPFILATTSITW
jgi:hypothetical protein